MFYTIILWALIFSVCGCSLSNVDCRKSDIPITRKCIAAPFQQGRVVLDGNPDEPVWQKAEFFSDFVDAQGKSAGIRTEARIFHDDQYLYLALKCFEKRADVTA